MTEVNPTLTSAGTGVKTSTKTVEGREATTAMKIAGKTGARTATQITHTEAKKITGVPIWRTMRGALKGTTATASLEIDLSTPASPEIHASLKTTPGPNGRRGPE